jgi:formylglycine-generating enzyme required for sulfatase activity
MARLILGTLAMIVPFGVVLLTPAPEARTVGAQVAPVVLPPAGQELPKGGAAAHAEFKAAGVCARCHVVSVLEWGISKHVAEKTTCRDCHGPSRAHVANERNEVKPDSRPRGDQIARSCRRCHDGGCPETLETVSCQKCHHVHALVDPARQPKTDGGPFAQVLRRQEDYRRQMDRGEDRVRRGDWDSARSAFVEALALKPGDRDATARLALCKRRLDPVFPGFTVVGDAFDPATGLPRDVKVSELEIPMVLIPAGEFDLGADRLTASRPVHTVAVQAFYLGKYEVTQAQWQAVMGTNPSVHQGKPFADWARMPVESVSWDDCQQFIKRLNQRVAGGGFRLPSEAEWEFAYRAGTPDPPVRDASLGRFAWFRENARRDPAGDGSPQSPGAWCPRPVGTKPANPWGLHDMLGNVSEWCSSLYRPYPYDSGGPRESLDAPGMRILRGGGFADSAEGLDPALRHYDRPHRRHRWNGLRLARDVPRPP